MMSDFIGFVFAGLGLFIAFVGWGLMKLCIAKAADIERRSQRDTGIEGMKIDHCASPVSR